MHAHSVSKQTASAIEQPDSNLLVF